MKKKSRKISLIAGLVVIMGLIICFSVIAQAQVPTELRGKYTDEFLDWIGKIKQRYSGTTVNFACFATPALHAMKAMTPDFEQLSGIKINFYETELAKLHDKVAMDIMTGKKEYGLIMLPEVVAPEFWNLDYLEPLNPWLNNKMLVKTPKGFDYSDIHQGYTMMFTSRKGRIYGIPLCGEVALVMYRKDLFDRYGKEVPKTYQELLDLARFFTEQRIVEDGKRVYGISFRGRPALGGGNWVFSIIVFPFGGALVTPADDETPIIENPGTVKALKYEIELSEYGVPGIASFGPYDAVNQFRQGFAAMVIEASVFAPATADPETTPIADKVGYAALPAGPVGAYNATFSHSLAITADSKNKEAAYAYIVWMLSRANQDLYLDNGGSVFRISGLNDLKRQAKHPYYPAILAGLDQAADLYRSGLNSTPKTEHILQFINVWSINVSKALAGEISAEEAVHSMQIQMEEIIKE